MAPVPGSPFICGKCERTMRHPSERVSVTIDFITGDGKTRIARIPMLNEKGGPLILCRTDAYNMKRALEKQLGQSPRGALQWNGLPVEEPEMFPTEEAAGG